MLSWKIQSELRVSFTTSEVAVLPHQFSYPGSCIQMPLRHFHLNYLDACQASCVHTELFTFLPLHLPNALSSLFSTCANSTRMLSLKIWSWLFELPHPPVQIMNTCTIPLLQFYCYYVILNHSCCSSRDSKFPDYSSYPLSGLFQLILTIIIHLCDDNTFNVSLT